MAKGKPTFEEALERIEKIVDAIEAGEVGLEDSIKQFDEGMRLITHCRGVLADAELKIQKLQTGASGALEAMSMTDAPSGSDDDGKATDAPF